MQAGATGEQIQITNWVLDLLFPSVRTVVAGPSPELKKVVYIVGGRLGGLTHQSLAANVKSERSGIIAMRETDVFTSVGRRSRGENVVEFDSC